MNNKLLGLMIISLMNAKDMSMSTANYSDVSVKDNQYDLVRSKQSESLLDKWCGLSQEEKTKFFQKTGLTEAAIIRRILGADDTRVSTVQADTLKDLYAKAEKGEQENAALRAKNKEQSQILDIQADVLRGYSSTISAQEKVINDLQGKLDYTSRSLYISRSTEDDARRLVKQLENSISTAADAKALLVVRQENKTLNEKLTAAEQRSMKLQEKLGQLESENANIALMKTELEGANKIIADLQDKLLSATNNPVPAADTTALDAANAKKAELEGILKAVNDNVTNWAQSLNLIYNDDALLIDKIKKVQDTLIDFAQVNNEYVTQVEAAQSNTPQAQRIEQADTEQFNTLITNLHKITTDMASPARDITDIKSQIEDLKRVMLQLSEDITQMGIVVSGSASPVQALEQSYPALFIQIVQQSLIPLINSWIEDHDTGIEHVKYLQTIVNDASLDEQVFLSNIPERDRQIYKSCIDSILCIKSQLADAQKQNSVYEGATTKLQRIAEEKEKLLQVHTQKIVDLERQILELTQSSGQAEDSAQQIASLKNQLEIANAYNASLGKKYAQELARNVHALEVLEAQHLLLTGKNAASIQKLEQANLKISALESALAKAEADAVATKAELALLKQEREEITHQLETAKEQKATLEAELAKTTQAKAEVMHNAVSVRDRVKLLEANNDNIVQAREKSTARHVENTEGLEQKIAELTQQVAQLENNKAILENQIVTLTAKSETLEQKSAALSEEKQKMKKDHADEIENWQSQMSILEEASQQAATDAQVEITALTSARDAANLKISALEADLVKAATDAQAEIALLTKERDAANLKISKFKFTLAAQKQMMQFKTESFELYTATLKTKLDESFALDNHLMTSQIDKNGTLSADLSKVKQELSQAIEELHRMIQSSPSPRRVVSRPPIVMRNSYQNADGSPSSRNIIEQNADGSPNPQNPLRELSVNRHGSLGREQSKARSIDMKDTFAQFNYAIKMVKASTTDKLSVSMQEIHRLNQVIVDLQQELKDYDSLMNRSEMDDADDNKQIDTERFMSAYDVLMSSIRVSLNDKDYEDSIVLFNKHCEVNTLSLAEARILKILFYKSMMEKINDLYIPAIKKFIDDQELKAELGEMLKGYDGDFLLFRDWNEDDYASFMRYRLSDRGINALHQVCTDYIENSKMSAQDKKNKETQYKCIVDEMQNCKILRIAFLSISNDLWNMCQEGIFDRTFYKTVQQLDLVLSSNEELKQQILGNSTLLEHLLSVFTPELPLVVNDYPLDAFPQDQMSRDVFGQFQELFGVLKDKLNDRSAVLGPELRRVKIQDSDIRPLYVGDGGRVDFKNLEAIDSEQNSEALDSE